METSFPDILTLLPQRPPFICVDRLTVCDGLVSETVFMVPEDHVFCRDGHYTEAGLVETVAQTCAARIGYLNLMQQDTVKLGIIGAIRNFSIHALPEAGTCLTTRITVKSEVFGITLVDAAVTAGGTQFAECEMKISLTDIVSTPMNNPPILSAEKEIDIRFSEVDAMQIAWHGSYVLYAEDAREAFGAKYGIGYLDIYGQGFYTPVVDLQFSYKSPLVYGDRARVTITYVPSEAAKLQFEYTIWNITRNRLAVTGRTTQVFLDKEYKLMLYAPDFFTEWKKKHGQS